MATVDLYFDGEMHTCEVTRDRNDEYLCEAPNGRFAKFPADADLAEAVALHNEVNADPVEVIEDVTYGKMEVVDENGNYVEVE